MAVPLSDSNLRRTVHLQDSIRLPASSQTLGRQLAVLLLLVLMLSSAVVTCICTTSNCRLVCRSIIYWCISVTLLRRDCKWANALPCWLCKFPRIVYAGESLACNGTGCWKRGAFRFYVWLFLFPKMPYTLAIVPRNTSRKCQFIAISVPAIRWLSRLVFTRNSCFISRVVVVEASSWS
jgi:hypothetical protein